MESTRSRQEMKYVEANGFCFNIDEKMRYGFALAELMNDLKLSKVWLLGKVIGRYWLTIIKLNLMSIQLQN